MKNIDEVTVWDVLFLLESIGIEKEELNRIKWCDIESIMAKWLVKTANFNNEVEPNWNVVYRILCGNDREARNENVDILAAFIFMKNNNSFFGNEQAFYDFLLDQLKTFEKSFGNYIKNATSIYKNDMSSGERAGNRTALINELCNVKNLVSADTFNYDAPQIEGSGIEFHHINGNCENPIFGIDSDTIPADDPRYMFTKTYRRMSLDMLCDKRRDLGEFHNVIVFGHSLNKADYNYFFTIFDKLNIVDISSDSKVVFAYQIYDEQAKYKIESDLRKNISMLFQEYSKYKFGNDHSGRLLDQLTIQGKIIIYKI